MYIPSPLFILHAIYLIDSERFKLELAKKELRLALPALLILTILYRQPMITVEEKQRCIHYNSNLS
jgi:hypothetical protein